MKLLLEVFMAKEKKGKLSADEAISSLRNALTPINIKDLQKEGHDITALDQFEDVEPLSSGSLLLDFCLYGGIGKGKIIEYFGPSGSGKTHYLMYAEIAAQARGEIVFHIDAEDAFVPQRARQLGIKQENFIISRERIVEKLLPLIEKMIVEKGVTFIGIDSLDALLSQKMWGDSVGTMLEKHNIGTKAKTLGNFIKALNELVASSASKMGRPVTVIMTNQIRHDPGIMMGDNTISSGGEAPRFYSFQRVKFRAGKKIEIGVNANKKEIGRILHFTIEKNRLGPPKEHQEVNFLYERGMNRYDELLTVAKLTGLIDQTGSRYTVLSTGESFHGAANVLTALESDPSLFNDLRNQAMALVQGKSKSEYDETETATEEDSVESVDSEIDEAESA
jgi:recombination protein RecA